jgi:hypothetical protein
VTDLDERAASESPSNDCAWCARCFDSVLDLLDHVEEAHLVGMSAAA